jgi:hypothetical protein
MPVRSAAGIVTIAASLLMAGCGGDWPPLPGVEERGRQSTDTWETLRAISPWKRPLASDPTYRRLSLVYRKMDALQARVREGEGEAGEEYSQMRLRLDQHYAGTRSLVFRLRSSGAENTPGGKAFIESALASLEDLVREAERFVAAAESGRARP